MFLATAGQRAHRDFWATLYCTCHSSGNPIKSLGYLNEAFKFGQSAPCQSKQIKGSVSQNAALQSLCVTHVRAIEQRTNFDPFSEGIEHAAQHLRWSIQTHGGYDPPTATGLVGVPDSETSCPWRNQRRRSPWQLDQASGRPFRLAVVGDDPTVDVAEHALGCRCSVWRRRVLLEDDGHRFDVAFV